MIHRHPEPLLGFRGLPAQAQRAVAAVEPQRQQHAPGVAAGAARIVGGMVLHRLVLAVDDRGRDVRGDLPVGRHLEADAQRAAGFVAHGTAFGGGHGRAGTALPGDPALVNTGDEVHAAAVVQHRGLLQAQLLAVDNDGEVVRIRDVEDPLPGPGEAVRVFRVLDVPGLMEAVDEAAGKFGIRGGPVRAADPQMPVAEAEQGLQGAGIAGEMDGLDQLPGIVGEPGAVRGDESHGLGGSFGG